MKKLILVLSVLALAAALPASDTTGISGVVTDAKTGQPIPCARVITSPGRGMAMTGRDGAYLLTIEHPGNYAVGASAEGYEEAHYPDSVVVTQGHVTPDINIALQPAGSHGTGGISGRVIDAQTQQPIAMAMVGVMRAGACTDSNGNYEIDRIPAGRYQVFARAREYEQAVYPDSVTVVEGQVTQDINFALTHEAPHGGAISGRVTDSLGAIIPHVMVTAAHERLHHDAMQGEKGYRIDGLPAGTYWVTGMARDYEPGHYPDSVTVTDGQTTEHIDFTLSAAQPVTGGISGFVTNAQTGEPLLFAAVVARGPEQECHAVTDSTGAYLIRRLDDGEYRVFASARGFTPSDVELVEVVNGQITHINFALQPRVPEGAGGISGAVTDSATGLGIGRAFVFAWGEHGQSFGVTDSFGNYLLRRVRAGSYVLRACARGYYPQTHPETVAVAAGETIPGINFVLPPLPPLGAGFAGFVFDGVGQNLLAGAHVTAIGPGGSFETYADANGDYVFDNLSAGDYDIQTDASGYEAELGADPIHVDPANIVAFTSPAVYPLNAIEESAAPRAAPGLRLVAGPNPFSGQTQVRYSLPRSGNMSLKVYDAAGKLVSVLVQGHAAAGEYSIRFERIVSGIYLLRFESDGNSITQKLIVR